MSTNPTISASLSIRPDTYSTTDSTPPMLTVTAVSNASEPITILTYQNIFNLSLALSRGDFECYDLTADSPVRVATQRGPCHRHGFDRTKGRPMDQYFVTLEPGAHTTFDSPLRWVHDQDLALTEGHRYRVLIRQDQVVRVWWYGRRDDLMASRTWLEWLGVVRRLRPIRQSSGKPLELLVDGAVEFEILHPKDLEDRTSSSGG